MAKQGKALLILPYFGSFGPWFPLYLQSLAKQRTLDLLLLSDTEPPALPANARRVEMAFDELRELASARLRTPVRLHRTRNICDLRPAYGLVFEEFVQGYEYWAFGDEDVLYGDLDRMLSPCLDGIVDLVVPGINGKSGHLTLVRNQTRTNELAMRDPAYKHVLASLEHWAYDETSWRCGADVSSFHTVVTTAAALGELSIRRGLPRVTGVPRRGASYVYDGQRLYEGCTELLYYHWGRMRFRSVRWPDQDYAANGFAFDRYGFYDPTLGAVALLVRRSAGRIHEFASGARRRASEWRATLHSSNRTRRARASPRPSDAPSSNSTSMPGMT